MIYYYTREYIIEPELEYWNIDNPKRVNELGDQIYLAIEVSNIFEGKKFVLECKEGDVYFDFENELDENSKTQLDIAVYNHKHNL